MATSPSPSTCPSGGEFSLKKYSRIAGTGSIDGKWHRLSWCHGNESEDCEGTSMDSSLTCRACVLTGLCPVLGSFCCYVRIPVILGRCKMVGFFVGQCLCRSASRGDFNSHVTGMTQPPHRQGMLSAGDGIISQPSSLALYQHERLQVWEGQMAMLMRSKAELRDTVLIAQGCGMEHYQPAVKLSQLHQSDWHQTGTNNACWASR